MSSLNIAIVDDHPLFRLGVKQIFERFKEVKLVSTADNYEDLKKLCLERSINFIIMDADLSGQCGALLTQKIKKLFPTVKVLAFSAHEEEEYVYKMLESGAAGYVLKSADLEELKEAVSLVAKGKNYFSATISQFLLQPFKKKKQALKQIEKLTIREIELLKFIIKEELSNKEIADRLFISPRTVETHKRNIIHKLRVKNTIGLAKYFFQYSDSLNEIYGIPVE